MMGSARTSFKTRRLRIFLLSTISTMILIGHQDLNAICVRSGPESPVLFVASRPTPAEPAGTGLLNSIRVGHEWLNQSLVQSWPKPVLEFLKENLMVLEDLQQNKETFSPQEFQHQKARAEVGLALAIAELIDPTGQVNFPRQVDQITATLKDIDRLPVIYNFQGKGTFSLMTMLILHKRGEAPIAVSRDQDIRHDIEHGRLTRDDMNAAAEKYRDLFLDSNIEQIVKLQSYALAKMHDAIIRVSAQARLEENGNLQLEMLFRDPEKIAELLFKREEESPEFESLTFSLSDPNSFFLKLYMDAVDFWNQGGVKSQKEFVVWAKQNYQRVLLDYQTPGLSRYLGNPSPRMTNLNRAEQEVFSELIWQMMIDANNPMPPRRFFTTQDRAGQ